MSHIKLDEKMIINSGLHQKLSLRAIVDSIGKHPSSVSREILRHTFIRPRDQYHIPKNDCIHRQKCRKKFVCTPDCHFHKGNCHNCGNCNSKCKDYVKENCSKLKRFPHV